MTPAKSKALGELPSYRPAIRGTRHMVVTAHYAASHAAFSVLEAGGNAIDAGCAAGIAMGVLKPDLVSAAGVAPIVIYEKKSDTVFTVAGLGHWPKLTDPRVFIEEFGGKIPRRMPGSPPCRDSARSHSERRRVRRYGSHRKAFPSIRSSTKS